MPDHLPLVSVVIGTYNRAHLLPQSLDSVLAQDYPRFEVIVVDDGSTDQTAEVIRAEYADRVHYIRFEDNQGVAAATNAGIRAAEGELVAFQDDDDIWLPEKLTAQVQALHEHPECALAYGRALAADPDGKPTGDTYGNSGTGRTGDNFRLMLHSHPILKPTVVIRRQLFEEVGLCSESLETAIDTDLFLRITMHYPAVYLNLPLILVREHPGRKTRSERTSGKMARSYIRVSRKLWDLLPPERERFRGIVASLIVSSELEAVHIERQDSHSPVASKCLEMMRREPELFDYYLAFHGAVASLLRFSDEPEADAERLAAATSLLPPNHCSPRRRESMLYTAAARCAIRQGSPFLVAKYVLKAFLMDPLFVIHNALSRLIEAVAGR